MPNKDSRLLSSTELLDIYGTPILNDLERQEYFVFNEQETNALYKFKDQKEAIYFAICLVFFKIKRTFIDFNYRDVTADRQHIINQYFPGKPSPKSLPNIYNKIRIQNKVLALCGYQRFTKETKDKLKKDLYNVALHHPRQRQLCKELLNLLVKHHIAIPGYTSLQDIVSQVWNHESKRLMQTYLRYTNKHQRQSILSLLNKTDELHRIVSVKQDMKNFNTHELWKELDKHEHLHPIFDIAKVVLPQLALPTATIAYYANLIHYYDGPGLKQLNSNIIGLYLLCYTFTRYQSLNDNLLEAFKKKTLEYKKKAIDYAKDEALKQLDLSKEARERASEMLITVKNHRGRTIPKEKLFKHIPEDQLVPTAHLLVNDSFNKELSFWKYIDSIEDTIKLNLQRLFLKIDFVVTNNNSLKEVMAYVKGYMLKGSAPTDPCPSFVKAWVGKQYHSYILRDNQILFNRLVFLLFMRMAYHLGTNKLSLQYSIKHKKVEDELYDQGKWQKNKKAILAELDYPKLVTPIHKTLSDRKESLRTLYHTVNEAIEKGGNSYILINKNRKGQRVWKLSPLEVSSDPNESLFALLQQRSIVEVIQFVNRKTNFCKAFEPILPKSTKIEPDPLQIGAVALANAIRIGSRKMADISDLKESTLLTIEADYIRLETLLPAIDMINNAVAEFPIFKEWHIQSILHGSLDGLKIETSLKNILARHSTKFFGEGVGVSAYSYIINGLSIASRLIGSHEYEGHHSFEIVHHQNTSEIKPTTVSTDKHGMNALNFALFDLTDMIFAPRIPKPHREILWGFGSVKDYEGLFIKPIKFIDENLIEKEWDNMQRVVASLLTGEASPSSVIRKLCAKEYNSKTKKALLHYNHMVRSEFILTFIHDPEFRRAILYALNRGEHHNGLYRAISLLNNGELRGRSEIEMQVWHHCTRLIAAIIHYYDAYILNSLYLKAKTEEEKEYLIGLSPTARVHINLIGNYQFNINPNTDWMEQLLREWDWQNDIDFVEKKPKKNKKNQ